MWQWLKGISISRPVHLSQTLALDPHATPIPVVAVTPPPLNCLLPPLIRVLKVEKVELPNWLGIFHERD